MDLWFDDDRNRLIARGPDGREKFRCEARNSTVRPGQFFRFGPCPRGTFRLGKPVRSGLIPFGPWFIPVLDVKAGHGPMARFRRAGIGIHGGGSGLAKPLALLQGWRNTHGCIRIQNESLAPLVAALRLAAKEGEPLRLHVVGKAS